ncbi:MAG: C25 family cysteine peptidase, partial [Candidatus Zixiibacteriota bacterium]
MRPLTVSQIHISIRRFKNRTALILLTLISCIIPANSLFANAYNNIKILNSDAHSISFTIEIKNPLDYAVFDSNDSLYNVVIPVLIGLPPFARPMIKAQTGNDLRSIDWPDEMEINRRYSSLAEIVEVKAIRNHKIVQVNIYPVNESGYLGLINLTVEFMTAGKKFSETTPMLDNEFFNGIFESTLLNYKEFKNWEIEGDLGAVKKTGEHPFDKNLTWYKIANSTEGILRVGRIDLANAGLSSSSINSADIHVYYGGGEPLPVYNADPRPDFAEIPIQVFDGGDGFFQDTDYLIFFAEAADRWEYESGSSPEYMKNPYTDLNYYWLCIDNSTVGLRMENISGLPDGTEDSTFTRARFYNRIEQDNILWMHSDGHIYDYYNWYWTNNSQITFYQSLPNAIYNLNSPESSFVHLRAVSYSSSGTFLSINAVPATRTSVIGNDIYYYTTQLKPDQLNSVSLTLGVVSNGPFFDFCEIDYPGTLKPNNGRLDFSIRGFTGSGKMTVENSFAESPLLFDISDPINPIQITNANIALTIDYQLDFQSGENRRFYICQPSRFIAPHSIEKETLNHFRNENVQADLIIIAPRQFANSSSLADFIDYRETTESQANGSFNIKLVALEDIIDEFAYGQYDPTAIRDYLKFTFENYSP